MTNSDRRMIEALTADELRQIRMNLQLDTKCPSAREDKDEETREAAAAYITDGGEMADLLPYETCADCDEAWEVQFHGVNLCHKHRDEREAALESK